MGGSRLLRICWIQFPSELKKSRFYTSCVFTRLIRNSFNSKWNHLFLFRINREVPAITANIGVGVPGPTVPDKKHCVSFCFCSNHLHTWILAGKTASVHCKERWRNSIPNQNLQGTNPALFNEQVQSMETTSHSDFLTEGHCWHQSPYICVNEPGQSCQK